jgi:hypothetical protein
MVHGGNGFGEPGKHTNEHEQSEDSNGPEEAVYSVFPYERATSRMCRTIQLIDHQQQTRLLVT